MLVPEGVIEFVPGAIAIALAVAVLLLLLLLVRHRLVGHACVAQKFRGCCKRSTSCWQPASRPMSMLCRFVYQRRFDLLASRAATGVATVMNEHVAVPIPCFGEFECGCEAVWLVCICTVECSPSYQQSPERCMSTYPAPSSRSCSPTGTHTAMYR